MKVSVVIPAYNAEKWIERCLESVMKQTYKNLEVIVLNDGSTDNTLEIISRLSKEDERILLINKENTGTYLTRKLGVAKASGEFIFNVDADDFLEDFALELLMARMLSSEADMVIGNHFRVLNGKRKKIENLLPLKPGKIELLRSLLRNHIKGYIWGKLYKKSLLEDMDYSVPQLLQEDVLANLHILMKDGVTVALENTPVYNYVIHPQSANSSKNSVFIENVRQFIDITENLLIKAGLLGELKDDFALFKCRNWIVYSRMGGDLAKNKEFRNNFYRESYTAYARSNLEIHHKVEMEAYRYNYNFGRFTTTTMKKLYNMILLP